MSNKNSIEKKKSALIGLAIAVLVLGLIALAGGVVLTVFGAINLTANQPVAGGIMLGCGILLIILGIIGVIWGIRYVWVGSSIKATQGSIAQENLAKAGTPNGKKCPKCGCTNTPDSVKCTSCGADLD